MQRTTFLLTSTLMLGATAAAQTSFDNDGLIAPAFTPPGILTEGFPGAPVVAIPAAAMGLGPLDEIDALSYGDDAIIQGVHTLVFSPDFLTMGFPGTGTAFEFGVDTAPGVPPAAAGDIFVQVPPPFGNALAPPGSGYAAGTLTGDESNATWPSPCVPGAVCADLDAFDYGDPMLATGVYFSLAPGSPILGVIGATPSDILYSDLLGGLPIVALLAGAGPATGLNLGIPGLNLDALNCVGSTGPIAAGGGVILPGIVGPSVAGIFAPASTHLVQYSTSGTGGIDADVLVRIAGAVFGLHTPAPALGLMPFENLNALEVTQPLGPCPPTAATVFPYNGTGINLDTMTASKAIVGLPWTATIAPQPARSPGIWIVLMRTAPAAIVLDLGPLFALPPAGLSELLVGGGVIANFFPGAHGGGGAAASFSALVPSSCALVGLSWYAQAIVFGDLPIGPGTLDPWLSSAAGGVVGTF